jgi:hypothetical protein
MSAEDGDGHAICRILRHGLEEGCHVGAGPLLDKRPLAAQIASGSKQLMLAGSFIGI